MKVEQEEKLLKNTGIIYLLSFLPLNLFIKDAFIKSIIVIILLIIVSILYVRKYLRDKKEGKDLLKYKRTLFFIFLTILIFYVFLVLPNFQ